MSNQQWSVKSEPVLAKGVSTASTETPIGSTTVVYLLLVIIICNHSLWIELVATHTSFCWDALGCASIPTAIILADPCGFVPLHQNKTIITEVDCT